MAKTAKTKRNAAQRPTAADNRLWIYATIPLVVSLIGVAVAFLVIGWQVVQQGNAEHRAERAGDRADAYQAAMIARIDAVKKETITLANSSLVRDAISTYEADLLAVESMKIGDMLFQAARVDIIVKGAAEVDLNADVPISFAALDLIKRAETQAFVGPEIALNHSQYAYVAAPITVEGVVRGVLFVALNTTYFYDNLKSYDENGELQIKQNFGRGGTHNVVMQHGDAEEDALNTPLNRQLNVDHWTLSYASPKESETTAWVSLFAPFAVIVAFILAGVLIGFTRLFNNLEKDADQLSQYTSRLLRGRSPNLEPYKLPLMQRIAQSLTSNASKATPKPQSNVKDKDDGDGDEDEIDFLKDLNKPAAAADAVEASSDNAGEEEDNFLGDDEDEEENDFLDVSPAQSPEKDAHGNFGIEVLETPAALSDLDPGIFRAYDIRGIVPDKLNAEIVYYIGRAFASEARVLDHARVVVGRDGRVSSPELRDELVRGLVEGGMDVIDIGVVPTPLLYYSTHALDTGTGIMITGSHNAPEYNGLKMMLAGVTLAEERIQKLLTRIDSQDFSSGTGGVDEFESIRHYTERVLDDVAIAQPLKIVVDCGNGVAGLVAPTLLEEMGCEVIPLYTEVDGSFPNHHPDPADPANMEDLITVVKDEGADLGFAFDGDGDRLGLVTNEGTIVWPDKMMMLFARDIVGRNPGADIVYDVKCSRHLNNIISEFGGRPIMWKTGHSHIKAHIKSTNALLGGEFSGHICFAERWYGFDDAIYAAARLLEIVSSEADSVERIFAGFPTTFTTPELKIASTDDGKFEFMKQLMDKADFGVGALTTIDGLRVDYEDGWGLIRPSNTSPVLSLRFEADTEAGLERIQQLFREQIKAIDSSLNF